MLTSKYNYEKLNETLEGKFQYSEKTKDGGSNHAVAVVGFDDDLYKDHGYEVGPGAFIVKNSWNENDEIHKLRQEWPLSKRDQESFNKFRAKINPHSNEVGYYAIPYQYIYDLIHRHQPNRSNVAGTGGISIYNINYNAFYHFYTEYEQKYETVRVPFTCNNEGTKEFIKRLYPSLATKLDSGDEKEKANAVSALMKLVRPVTLGQQRSPFYFAYVSNHRGISENRVQNLYEGDFFKYYCGDRYTTAGPPADILVHPDFDMVTDRATLDPYGLGTGLYFLRMLFDYYGGH
ncbi:MAG: hypothetical protein H6626_06930 [Pseudobdellovibrionaceae bacterium]|nr:hypothetical protein [Bdellovibrionales bacterium]USN48817.1 MAG: hypothetical protein H6626_06930 [Pseudobdellovibrionaceae bacterium]